MNNEDLKEIYNSGIKPTFSSFEESLAILNMRDDWEGKTVLEIGCGEGDLCALLTMANADIAGMDYSENKIKKFRIKYPCIWHTDESDYHKLHSKYDIVIMQGVLEHFDEPFEELKWILDNLATEAVITSSPCFINPRGYVWQTIQILFDIKMSLTDLWEINPWNMEEFCNTHGYFLRTEYSNYDWACGEKTIVDFNKRFKSEIFKEKYMNAIGKGISDEKIDEFLNWLENALFSEEYGNLGANAIYEIRK